MMHTSVIDFGTCGQLIHASQDQLYRLAYCYVKNEHDALDIVGEATYKALVSLHTLQRAEPAGLTFTFTKDDTQTDSAPVYYLRTEAMPYGESLGIAAERFWGKETTQVRTEEGNYIVTVGEYQSESEAQSALDALNAELGETGLTIASSLPDERPHDAE